MSLNYYYDQVARLEKDIADLQRKISDETRKELDKQKQIDSINRSISSSTSISTLQSKQRQIQGYQSDILRIQTTKADYHKKVASKTSDLSGKKQELHREEIREREKQKKEQEDFQRKLQSDISNQKQILNTLIQQNYSANTLPQNKEVKKYDFFISHASEDKESFVRPLAELLIKNGLNVWYDEFQLTIGDSLRKKIDEGLKFSKYGIVVLSRDFFRKNWPEYELNGLVAREMNGVRVILPIWHNVTRDEVLSFSPTLADKVALNTTAYSLVEIVNELKKLI
jgi:hypothetical protein